MDGAAFGELTFRYRPNPDAPFLFADAASSEPAIIRGRCAQNIALSYE
jgi:hypothetical protein